MANPYGYAHRKERSRALPDVVGTPCACPGCNKCRQRGRPCTAIITPSNAHFDHSTPVALGGSRADRFLCTSCNCSLGATLGNRLRARIRQLPRSGSI